MVHYTNEEEGARGINLRRTPEVVLVYDLGTNLSDVLVLA